MTLTDDDGDTLEIQEVRGFGRPRIMFQITQEGEESAMNLDEAQAKQLVEWLTAWLGDPE